MNREALRKLAKTTHIDIAELVGTDKFTISGGFLRDSLNDEEPKDIDCFFIDVKEYDIAVKNTENFEVITTRKQSVQIKLDNGGEIDLILTYENYVFDFDFHMNQLSYIYADDVILMNEEVEEAIRKKYITIATNKLPLNLLERAKKFYERGWKLGNNTKLKLINNYLLGVDEPTY